MSDKCRTEDVSPLKSRGYKRIFPNGILCDNHILFFPEPYLKIIINHCCMYLLTSRPKGNELMTFKVKNVLSNIIVVWRLKNRLFACSWSTDPYAFPESGARTKISWVQNKCDNLKNFFYSASIAMLSSRAFIHVNYYVWVQDIRVHQFESTHTHLQWISISLKPPSSDPISRRPISNLGS